MNKLQMAHEYGMQLVASPDYNDDMSLDDFTKHCWKYADLMQAEADKRKENTLSDQTNGQVTQYNISETGATFAINEVFVDKEWQPDWSQAPVGYDWFAVDRDNRAYFFTYEPEKIIGENYWADFTGVSNSTGTALESKTTFGYQGDWRDSLRKRPE